MLADTEIKKQNKILKKIIKDGMKFNDQINISRKRFDPWKPIIKEFSEKLDTDAFTIGNNAWGANLMKINEYFFDEYFKSFRGHKISLEKQEKKFFSKILSLLKKSQSQFPMKIERNRKIPFKQSTRHYQEPALTGNETIYKTVRKSKIKFFKGSVSDEKLFIKKKWDKLFSHGFVYGYFITAITIIFKLGKYDWVLEDPKDSLSDQFAKFEKNYLMEEIFNHEYERKILSKVFNKLFKLKKTQADEYINKIEDSVYRSRLSLFLSLKNENYFPNRKKKFLSDESDGYQDFLDNIIQYASHYLANTKDKKFIDILINTRKTRPKMGLGFSNIVLLTYDEFYFYTSALKFQTPFDLKKFDINDEDIFMRYAIHRGSQEFLYYTIEKIYSPTFV